MGEEGQGIQTARPIWLEAPMALTSTPGLWVGTVVYVNPLVNQLAPAEEEGRGVGSTCPAAETIPRQPVLFATWRIYNNVTIRLKYTKVDLSLD